MVQNRNKMVKALEKTDIILTINAISSAAKDSGIDEDKAFELGMLKSKFLIYFPIIL